MDKFERSPSKFRLPRRCDCAAYAVAMWWATWNWVNASKSRKLCSIQKVTVDNLIDTFPRGRSNEHWESYYYYYKDGVEIL